MISSLAVPLFNLASAAAVVLLVLSLQNASLVECRLCSILPYYEDAENHVVAAAIFLILFSLARHLAVWVFLVKSQCLVEDITNSLVKQLTRKYLSIPWLEFASRGRATSIKNCIDTTREASKSYDLLLDLIRYMASVMVLAIGVLVQAPKLGLSIFLIVVIALWLIRRYLQPKIKFAGDDFNESMRDLHRHVSQSFEAGREIRVYKAHEVLLKPVTATLEKLANARKKLFTLPSITWMLFDGGITIAIGFIVLGTEYVNNSGNHAVLLADLGMIIVVAGQLVPSVNNLLSAIAQLPGLSASINLISKELRISDHVPGIKLINGPAGVRVNPGLINIYNISLAYRDNLYIIRDLNMIVHPGDRIAIVGPSGSGKSSLLMLIAGLLIPSDGEVSVRDSDRLAYVPQETVLLDDTILSNILFGLEEHDEEFMWRLLADVNLEEFIKHLPEGLDTLAGDNGVCLSGGQRQRLGIARALYRRPQLLLLDEATSALDSQAESIVMSAIVESSSIGAVVFVTHRMQAAAKANRVFSLMEGKLVQISPLSLPI